MSLYTFGNKIKNVGSSAVGKWLLIIIGALLAFSLAFSNLGSSLFGAGRGVAGAGTAAGANDTIATVNGDPITRADFQQAAAGIRQQAQQFGQPVGPAQASQLNALVLNQLVTQKLQLQQAQKLSLTVSADDIAKARQQAVDRAGVAQHLGLKPGASVADIDAAFAKDGQQSIENRLPDDAVRQNVLLDKLQTYQSNKVVVTEADARASFRQWHTRHILLDTKKRTDAQAQVQAQQLLEKVKQPGTDFAALAKQISDDPGSKDKGGDDGWIDQSTQYVPEFKTAAFALKAGEVTLVKSAQYGYFVIKADAVRDNLPKDFDKNKAQYIAQVKSQKQQQAQQDFQNSLQNNPANKIVVSDPELKADKDIADAAHVGDPAKAQAASRQAIADYQAALKNGPSAEQSVEINASLAAAYRAAGQNDQAIAALQTALKSGEDADLRLSLGTLYAAQKQNEKALAEFQSASKAAWDNPGVHSQLQGEFSRLGKPQLAAAEAKWLSEYQARQQAQQMQQLQQQMPPPVPTPAPKAASGAPVPNPTSGAPVTVKTPGAVQVVPSGSKPMPSAPPKPAQ